MTILDDKPIAPREVLTKTFRENNDAFASMEDVFILGLVDDRVLAGKGNTSPEDIRREGRDYDGILIFGVPLRERDGGRRPTVPSWRISPGLLTGSFTTPR